MQNSSDAGDLKVSIGQFSSRGVKPDNQDFHGAMVPEGTALHLKGVALALSDGISTSPVSQVASETTVKTFLTDYYSTSDSWTARTAGFKVIEAVNSWLHSETLRSQDAHDLNRGYVCTFSSMILKGRTAHLFHVGDSRIYRVSGESLEQLTKDHRVVISEQENYLGRAVGLEGRIDVDYQSIPISQGDVFVLTTDGVHDYVSPQHLVASIKQSAADLDQTASAIVEAALENGSTDNLTIQIVRVDALPDGEALEFIAQTESLSPAPPQQPPCLFDGYELSREIHANHRSRIYLGRDTQTGIEVALKVPSLELAQEPTLLRQFMMEEWIARRISSPHVLKAVVLNRSRSHLYVVTEFVHGQSLRQWMTDHPEPDLEAVRDIIRQLVEGVRALHRKEMLHCDLRPENVMIDEQGTVKLIDFGSVRVAGIAEATPDSLMDDVLGTVQYTAPECLAGDPPSRSSDIYSIGVIAYEMLTGRLPYGGQAARIRQHSQIRALQYKPARMAENPIPEWMDSALRRAVHPDPFKRYHTMSEFVGDLKTPNRQFKLAAQAPLAERDPELFWKLVSLCLAIIVLMLLVTR